MNLAIDVEKLRKILLREIAETRGACCESQVCIGKVGGREIHLIIQANPDNFMDETRWHCVGRSVNIEEPGDG